MAYFTFPWFHQRFFDNQGNPLAGGSITFYRAGSTALKSIYVDQSGVQAKNPMPLDSTGIPEQQYFAEEGEYDVLIRDADGANIQKVLRINCVAGASSPFPDPENPGFLHWDGDNYAWIEIPMYPTPGNSGYLHYDAGTQTYSWVAIAPDDHKVANSDTDVPGYLKDKIVDSDTVRWSEIIVDGASVLKADTIDLDKVPAVVVWNIMDPSDPQTAPFGLSNEDINAMIDTGFGVASQMQQSTFQSNLSIWYATGTYWGDAVWEEKKFPLGTCITNLNKQVYDYLHDHPEEHPVTNPSNYPAGIYTAVMVGDGLYWESLLVQQYPEPDFNITSLLKYDAVGKAFVWLNYNLLQAMPVGPAGGDLFGYYPDPIVRQLTGVGTSLVSMDVQGAYHASGPGITGFTYGRGCTPGRIYKNGVHTSAWIAQSSNGDMYISTDKFKKATKDTSLSANTNWTNTAAYGYGAQCIHYGKVAKTDTVNSWIVFKQSFSGFFYALDVVGNYNSDGTLKQSAWVKVANSNIMDSVAHSVSTKDGGILLTAAYMNGVTYYSDLNGTGNKFNASEEISGIATDSYGTYYTVARNSGKLYRNISEQTGTFDNTAWAVFDHTAGFTIDGVAADHFPITGSGGGLGQTWWAGLGCAYGLWVCTVALKHLSTDPTYAYSDNGIDWITYGNTSDTPFTTWDMKSDGVFWFGCPTNSPTPLVYQILVNSIPAHKRLICEKGLLVSGDMFLADMPNAGSLSTDENGKVVAGAGAVAQIGDAPKTDYVYSPYNSQTRKWVPNGKASGPVEALMGALVRDDTAHTVTVPAYTVQLFDNENFLGQPLRYSVAQSTLTISTANTVQYIVSRYISPGVAQTILTPFLEDINWSSVFPLFIVERVTYTDGSSRIHQVPFDTLGEGLAQKINSAMVNIEPYRRDRNGGLMITSTGLHVALTASTVYAGVVPHTILSYDSNSDKLFHAYMVGGVWTYAVETAGTVNNTQYQNGTDLASLGTNKWKNVWIYRSIGDDKECFYIDGTAQYNTSDAALAETIPTLRPDIINWHCMLVGRITVQNGTTTGYTTQSAFVNPFAAGSSTSGFIRNQPSTGTNDSPGNIFTAPDSVWKLRYEDTSNSANNVDWVAVSKDLIKIQGLDVNNPALIGYSAEMGPGFVAVRGRPGTSYGILNAAAILNREGLNWVPNANNTWFDFFYQDLGGGTAQANGGFMFPRLKMRIGASDTVSAELEHKIVDSTGAELAQATNGSYGKAIVIPTAVLSGTPNGEQLFNYAVAEGDAHTISQAGTDSGNCSGNRGFAFVANASRLMTKGRIMITQTGGSWFRIGIYDANGVLLGKSNRVAVASGMIWAPFTTPVQLVGGTLYYMAYWCDDTTGNLKFPCVAGRSTQGFNPLPQIYDINNEMPNNLGTSGTATQYRPWLMVSE